MIETPILSVLLLVVLCVISGGFFLHLFYLNATTKGFMIIYEPACKECEVPEFDWFRPGACKHDPGDAEKNRRDAEAFITQLIATQQNHEAAFDAWRDAIVKENAALHKLVECICLCAQCGKQGMLDVNHYKVIHVADTKLTFLVCENCKNKEPFWGALYG